MGAEFMRGNVYPEVRNYFDYDSDWAFLGLICDIIDEIDEVKWRKNKRDAVYTTIENIFSSVRYYDDLWAVIKHYCTPFNANLDNAIEMLVSDVIKVATKIFED